MKKNAEIKMEYAVQYRFGDGARWITDEIYPSEREAVYQAARGVWVEGYEGWARQVRVVKRPSPRWEVLDVDLGAIKRELSRMSTTQIMKKYGCV